MSSLLTQMTADSSGIQMEIGCVLAMRRMLFNIKDGVFYSKCRQKGQLNVIQSMLT